MAKKAATKRVHQLAKELGVDSKDIVAKCQAEGIPDIVNHMSTISIGLSATIREWFTEGAAVTAVEVAAAVDVEKARARARRRPSKKAGAADKDGDEDTGGGVAIAVEEPDRAAPLAPATPATPARRGARAKPLSAPGEEAPDQDHPSLVPDEAALAPAALAPVAEPEAPVIAPRKDKAKLEPPAPAPVMNVPARPKGVIAAGPQLRQPKKVEMKGPKVIRVEAPEVVAAPKARGARTGGPVIGRGGPRAGRGVGPVEPEAPGRGGERGGPTRRNKRRSGSAFEETGRTGRLAPPTTDEARPFNWRQQDLLERENRLNRAGGFFRQARRDNLKRATGGGQRAAVPAEVGGKVRVQAPISIKDLSAATGVKMSDIVKKLFMTGKVVTANSILDAESAVEAVIDYGIDLEIDEIKTAEQRIAATFLGRESVSERRRSPVVTILGHVDHGKTSLLDRIRNANVAAGEAGGITQATSAFQVPVRIGEAAAGDGAPEGEHLITFIDTPGHEAFTEMRARGAKVTDIVVLVVAADDGVMPQTVESINHAKAASVPIVVALNKIDKPEATDGNIQRILGQLAQHELNPVEWGGSTEVVRTSATLGTGIQDLLETLDYQAQLLELSGDFGGTAGGTVLEASMQEGRGPVARVLIQQGLLRKGDFVAVGRAFGRVRDIVNDRGQRIEEAGPSTPVAFSGINEIPDAGDKFYVVKNSREAEEAANDRTAKERQRDLAREKVTLSNVFERLQAAGKKELPLIVKADVQGSLETLRAVLGKITSDEVTVAVKHTAVGGVNESDVSLAETTGAIILGFNVTASGSARKAADARGVDIRFYDVIYDLTDDVTKAVEGMLEPELRLEVLGHAEVRDVFKISKVGMIAGCYVTDGVIERNAQIRVTRDGIVIEKDRRLEQLKRFKDDAREVRAGQECGMNIEGYDDIKTGDVLECYKTREVKRKL